MNFWNKKKTQLADKKEDKVLLFQWTKNEKGWTKSLKVKVKYF